MEWEPTDSVEVVKVAFPLLIVPVPSVLVPSLKVTVPVAPDGVTVAVNVTEVPKVDGFADELKPRVVLVLLTVWVSVGDVLAL